MPFKLNISEKGKTWKIELDSEALIGKKLGEKISGKEIKQELEGYELIITGASDIAGFPHKKDIEGIGLRRVILTDGWGMHKKPKKEGKKKVSTPKGLRLRKTLRGNQISDKTVQINLTVEKKGSKSLEETFPEQNKPKESEKPAEQVPEEKQQHEKQDSKEGSEKEEEKKK